MTLNEIKKSLLKDNPQARLSYIRKGSAFYYADLAVQRVYFLVPVNDMGDADFGAVMDSKSLLRWIVVTED